MLIETVASIKFLHLKSYYDYLVTLTITLEFLFARFLIYSAIIQLFIHLRISSSGAKETYLGSFTLAAFFRLQIQLREVHRYRVITVARKKRFSRLLSDDISRAESAVRSAPTPRDGNGCLIAGWSEGKWSAPVSATGEHEQNNSVFAGFPSLSRSVVKRTRGVR